MNAIITGGNIVNFQDVVDLSIKQEEILTGVEKIIDELKLAREIYNSWIRYSFNILYSGSILSTGVPGSARDNTVAKFNEIREQLISIDSYDLAIILANALKCFNNSEIEKYIKTIEVNYKNVVYFRTLTKVEDRIREIVKCIESIDNVINAYQSIINIIRYIKVIDTELSQGIKEPALMIRSNVENITEESIKYIIHPITIIYNKLCEIGNINALDEPLRIVRVESGTLNFKFDGNNAICNVIAKIIEDYHNIFIRKFTRGGKKENLAESLDLVTKELDIISNMKELGMDTSNIESIAQETMGLIVKETNIFLTANPDVKINEKQLSRSEDIKKLLSEPKYLESAIDVDDE